MLTFLKKILNFPADTRLFLCHDYPPANRIPVIQETIEQQRKNNIHLKGAVSEQDFVHSRKTRDAMLSAPKLIYPAIQVNIAAGKLPKIESNQQMYFKIPLTIKEE